MRRRLLGETDQSMLEIAGSHGHSLREEGRFHMTATTKREFWTAAFAPI